MLAVISFEKILPAIQYGRRNITNNTILEGKMSPAIYFWRNITRHKNLIVIKEPIKVAML